MKWSAHLPTNESESWNDLERRILIEQFRSKTQKMNYFRESGPLIMLEVVRCQVTCHKIPVCTLPRVYQRLYIWKTLFAYSHPLGSQSHTKRFPLMLCIYFRSLWLTCSLFSSSLLLVCYYFQPPPCSWIWFRLVALHFHYLILMPCCTFFPFSTLSLPFS